MEQCICNQPRGFSLYDLLAAVICNTLFFFTMAFALGAMCGRLIWGKKAKENQSSCPSDPVYDSVSNTVTVIRPMGIELNDNIAYTVGHKTTYK